MTQPVTGPIDSQYGANMSMHIPEYRRKIFLSKGDQFAEFFEFVQALGRFESVAQEEGNHWEEGDRYTWIEVATTGTAGAISNNGTSTSGAKNVEIVPVGGKIFARENDIIRFSNGVAGIIQEITPGTPYVLEVIPTKEGSRIPVVTDGEHLMVETAAFGEGTDQPEGRRKQFYQESYALQIFKETLEATGTEKTNATWAAMPDGNGINTLYHINQPDAEYRLKMQIQNAFISGNVIDNDAARVDKDGNTRGATEGMLTFAESRGKRWPIASGALVVDDFNEIEAYAVSQRADPLLMFFSGLQRQQEINGVMQSFFNDSNVEQVRKTLDANLIYPEMSLAAIINYKLIQLAKCTMMFSSFDALNNPATYSLDGYKENYQGVSVILPFGKVRDPKSGKKIPHFGFVYKEKAGYNRMMEVWEDGSAKPKNRIGGVDKDWLYLRAHLGTRFAGGNQWQIIKNEAS